MPHVTNLGNQDGSLMAFRDSSKSLHGESDGSPLFFSLKIHLESYLENPNICILILILF